MVLVVPATNRREICFVRTNSARSTTFRRRVGPQLAYVSRSTSRHFPILVVPGRTWPQHLRSWGEMWAGKVSKKSPGAGVAMRGSVSVRGFDSTPFRPISGPGGSIRTHFPILGVPPWVPIIFPIISLFPRCGCAVLCTYFCPLVYLWCPYVGLRRCWNCSCWSLCHLMHQLEER